MTDQQDYFFKTVTHMAHVLIENSADRTEAASYKGCDYFEGGVQMIGSFVGGADSLDNMLDPCANACALVAQDSKNLTFAVDMIVGAAFRQQALCRE